MTTSCAEVIGFMISSKQHSLIFPKLWKIQYNGDANRIPITSIMDHMITNLPVLSTFIAPYVCRPFFLFGTHLEDGHNENEFRFLYLNKRREETAIYCYFAMVRYHLPKDVAKIISGMVFRMDREEWAELFLRPHLSPKWDCVFGNKQIRIDPRSKPTQGYADTSNKDLKNSFTILKKAIRHLKI